MSSSNVGNAQVYEAGDQRNPPDSEKAENQAQRHEEGQENSHKANDPKDERSIANRLEAAGPQNDDESGKATAEDKLAQEDPTAPARLHGNEPSKGAKIDAEIQAEEEAELAKKDAKKKGSAGQKN